jgi:2-polyprenyl-6-methoxyphenol hydroxylase-like FAD-dependent oxidoreductase
MHTIGEHAVVVGASMGGLLAARVLAEAYERVTIVERDELAASPGPRKGVPQGRHGHGLHPRGLQVLEELFPAFASEIATAGAPVFSSSAIRGVIGGHPLSRADVGAPWLSASRPFLEGHVRRRVTELDSVSIVDGCDVVGLTVGTSGDRVTGVRLLRRRDGSTEETRAADLVVCATGRAGRTLGWLDDLGFPRPAVDELRTGVVYATRQLRFPDGALGKDRIVFVGPQPGRLTGMYLAEQEDGWWVLTVFGYQGHEPPRDPEGFTGFAASVAPDLASVLAVAEPCSDVFVHRLPSSLWRRYERLRRFPDGFLVFGDAICSFNPIYGQGMTVAALQALALRRELHRRRFDARRFFRAAARPIGDAWDLATGSDLSLPEVPGPRSAKVRFLNAYVDLLLGVAERDATVSRAFFRTIGMLDRPPALLRPAVVGRVLGGALAGHSVATFPRPATAAMGPSRDDQLQQKEAVP